MIGNGRELVYHFGGCSSKSYRSEEKAAGVEEMVRTHMIAGHVAQDLIEADRVQSERR